MFAATAAALLDGVGPVLQPQRRAEAVVAPASHVTGGEDAVRGPASGIADQPVDHVEGATGQPSGRRGRSDRHHHDVGRQHLAGVQAHSGDLPAVTDQPGHCGAEP
jgi:hypothetical protein